MPGWHSARLYSFGESDRKNSRTFSSKKKRKKKKLTITLKFISIAVILSCQISNDNKTGDKEISYNVDINLTIRRSSQFATALRY